MTAPTEKPCAHCKESKPLDEYHRNKDTKDGRVTICKSCTRLYREANKERIAAVAKAWHQAHPERIREANRKWREKNPTYSRDHYRANREEILRKAKEKRAALKAAKEEEK